MLIIPAEPDVPQSVKYVDIFFTAIEIELRPKVGPHIHGNSPHRLSFTGNYFIDMFGV